jgi:hypothetical protein
MTEALCQSTETFPILHLTVMFVMSASPIHACGTGYGLNPSFWLGHTRENFLSLIIEHWMAWFSLPNHFLKGLILTNRSVSPTASVILATWLFSSGKALGISFWSSFGLDSYRT